MKNSGCSTYVAAALLLALAGIAAAQSTDWKDAYRRIIPEVHRTYLVGLRQGINDAGGMRQSDWVFINDMQERWNSTYDLLNRRLKKRRESGEEIKGSWVLRTYVTLLREHAFRCGHPIWTDTGTKDLCFEAISGRAQ